MTILYDLIYLLAVCVGWPYLLYRRLKRGPGSLALRQRLGKTPSRSVSAHCVWIHGVSLGEINATRTLVADIRRRSPDTTVVVSSTTHTGLDQALKLYPKLLVFRFPLDFSFVIRRLLEGIRPSIIVLMELEAWPNLIEVAAKHDIPVIIVNGRVTSEKSMRRFKRPLIRAVARRMFGKIRWVGSQDQVYAARFVELGVPAERVHVTGSLKYDAAHTGDRIEGQDELAEAMGIDASQPLWVCGSTGPSEETTILDAYKKLLADFANLQLAIIPRKPERFDEVASQIVDAGFACLRRSTGSPAVPAGVTEPRPVFLGDTMGELRKFYALAAVVFVGRSLVPMGGSDVMEAAGLAKPIVIGPHNNNFADAVNMLVSESAARRITSGDELPAAVADLLRHPQRCAQMGERARAAVISRRGATEETVDQILGMLP